MLNDDLNGTVGISENNSTLCESIVAVNENAKFNNGGVGYQKTPCSSTVKFYQMLSVNDDPSIHLIKDGNLKVKDERRQMASTLVRNLASHVAAVCYANFIAVPEKWSAPKGLPNGSRKLIEIMKNVTGAHFKPVLPAFLLNEDCSSQYYFSGSVKNDHANNGWSRVKDTSLEDRGKDAIWTTDTIKNNIGKVVRIKFACGSSAGGF